MESKYMENCRKLKRNEILKNLENLKVCTCTVINWHENKKCWLCELRGCFRGIREEDLIFIRKCKKNTLFSI